MTPHCFRAGAGLHGQKVGQHPGGDPVGEQSGKMCMQLVQFRRRAAILRPVEAGLGTSAIGTEPSPQPRYHLAEWRRNMSLPPVLEVTLARARRPANRVIPGLRGATIAC